MSLEFLKRNFSALGTPLPPTSVYPHTNEIGRDGAKF